jgi:acetylornithine aminotransferase
MELFDVYPLFDIEPVTANGCYVWDKNGRKYLDFYGGHAVISIGHSHPHYVQRMEEQLRKIAFYSNSVQNSLQQSLAQKLGEVSSCEDYQLFLCNSGAEANENALKMASFANGRKRIIAFKNGFHGRTSAAVNITDNTKIQAPINSTFPVTLLTLNDEDALIRELAKGNVAAVVIEGIQGIGGIIEPTDAFLQTAQQHCRLNATLLILDEVQSGFGRSGTFFAFQPAGIEPDLISIAKGMGNGFPVGGLLLHPRLEASHGLLGTTFGGNHLACAATLAVLEVIEAEDLMENALAMGKYLIPQLRQLPGVKEVRGRGLMIGLQLEQTAAPIRKKLLFEHGIFTGSSSEKNTIRLLPPLNISTTEADLLLVGLSNVLKPETVC